MTNWFLKAKHWQLFLLIFGLPFIIQIIAMGIIVTSSISGDETAPDPAFMFRYFMPVFSIMMLLFIFGLLGWIWSMASRLQKMLPEHVRLNLRAFKFFFFFPVVYMIVFLSIFFWSFQSSVVNPDFNPAYMFVGFAVIFPLHLFAIFCMFYVLYFTSKTIKMVELQKHVTFGDYAGEFFLLWFDPIGVWIIQPRINKLFEQLSQSA